MKKKREFPVKDFALPGLTKKKREAIERAVREVIEGRKK